MHKYVLFGTVVLVALLVYSTVRQRRKTRLDAGSTTYDDAIQDVVTTEVNEPIHQVAHQPYTAGVPIDELKPHSFGAVDPVTTMVEDTPVYHHTTTFDGGGSFGGGGASDSYGSCDSSSSSSDGGSSGGGCD